MDQFTNSTNTTLNIAKTIKKETERTNYILGTLSTEYTQQAFTHASRISHRMCSMQVRKPAWWWWWWWWWWWVRVACIKQSMALRPLCTLLMLPVILIVRGIMLCGYRQFSNMRRTKSQNLNVSRLVLHLSLPNPLKPCVKSRMKMQLQQRRQAMLQIHLNDHQSCCLLRCDLY